MNGKRWIVAQTDGETDWRGARLRVFETFARKADALAHVKALAEYKWDTRVYDAHELAVAYYAPIASTCACGAPKDHILSVCGDCFDARVAHERAMSDPTLHADYENGEQHT